MPLSNGYSWTPQGLDYSNKQSSEYQPPSREQVEQERAYNPTENWDWQNQDGLGPQGQALPEFATGWQPNGEADFGEGFGGWWNKAKSKVREAWKGGYEEGLKLDGITKGAITLAATAGKGKEAIPEGEKKVEEIQAGLKPKDENQAYWMAATEATKEMFNQGLWGILDGLSVPARLGEQALGSAAYAIADTIEGRDINWKRNWESSRMLYSGLFDATVFSEMERRIDSGMRGDLAAQEIMIGKKWTMWPELIGQVIFDPLNAYSAVGKAGMQIKWQKTALKRFHQVENPAILKLLDDVGNLDEAKAYQTISDFVKSQQGLVVASEHAEDIAQAGKDLEAFSKSYRLGQITSDGKVAHVANETGEIFMHVVNNAGPDEALEVLRGMVKSVSKDPAQAAEGVSAMLHFADAPALFSEAGNKTTLMMSRMVEKYGDNWLESLSKLKDNPAELSKNLLGKLEEVSNEMFPSVSKMLEAEDLVKKGGEVTEKVKALAQRAKELPSYVKSATRFHDNAQKIIGPINKAFVGAYMGWNPGFAFRNFSNNSVQLLIDYGPGVLLGKADDLFAKAEKLHGGIIPGAFSEGAEAAALFPELSKANARETGTKAVLNSVKEVFDKGIIEGIKKGPVLAASQVAEANAAKRIIAKTYRQTFDRGVGAMVKALTPDLKAAGFSDDIIKKLPTYIAQNDGNASKVIDALRTDIASGTIDLFNDMSRIDPKYQKFLNDTGKWDEYTDTVLKAATREEATAAAQKIFDELAQAGDYVYKEARPAVDNYDKFAKLAEKNGLPEQRGLLVSLRKTESRKAIQMAENILAEADDLGAKLGLDVGTMKKSRGITGLNTWGNDAAKEADRLSDLTWKLSNDSKSGNVQQMWLAYPELFQGPPPADLTSKSFRDALWSAYDGTVSKTWGGARDAAMDNVTKYLDDLKKAGAQIPDEWAESIKQAQEGAQQYDNAMIGKNGWLVEDTPMAYGTRSTQIRSIANKAGVASTAKEVDEVGQVVTAGADMDKKILAKINKYADVNYKSLEDVPLDVAEQAFKKQKPIVSASSTTPNLMQKAKEVPRSELPEEVSQRFADEAKRLQGELFGGEAGKRTAEGVTKSTNVSWYRELYQKGLTKPVIDKALDKIIMDAGSDKGVNVERMKDFIMDNLRFGDKVNGVPPDLKALQALGADEKTLAAALDDYNDITRQSKTLDEVLGVADEGEALIHDPDLPYFDDAGNLVEPKGRILPPATDGELPPVSRAIHEQMDSVKEMRKWMMDDITKNFGKKQVVDKVAETALRSAERELTSKLAETKLISSRVAQANREFTLLNYGDKSYWDTALAYLYPFHYWYKGTYANWMKRLAANPAILGHYARYKDILGTVHSEMPEWWRYNINSNDLPGVDVDNPLYFNLEATLWPLNGLTNTDFTDKAKTVNWWTYSLDYANKFGPSTWTPINMVTGLALYQRGEKEAGERWMGRLFPQSNVIKAAGSLLGQANLETDPFVNFLQGGLDPYERRRVGRALAEMEQQSLDGKLPYSQEQIQDAAYKQEGEIWDEAVKRAVNVRATSQVSSFLFGVGFKGRTNEDMQVDEFTTAYGKLTMMRRNLSTEEYREGMDALYEKYPFADTVLLSRRSGTERDSGLAYNVMKRIPPGQSSDIASAVGITPELMQKFYDTKGDLDTWSAEDRQKFMSGMITISAVLEIPDDMTKREWTEAKNAYTKVGEEAKQQFGDDILDVVDGYYQAKSVSSENAENYMEGHPEVEQYMDWKAQRVMESPLLSAYYGGASMIENYYRGEMYKDIEAKLGSEIFDIMDEYNSLKTYGSPEETKAFYNQNKGKIKQYYSMKDTWSVTINQNVAKMTANLPDMQGAEIRPDVDTTSVGAQQLTEALQPEQERSFEEFQQIIPERTMGLVQDYYNTGEPLPESARKQLERLANELGYGSSDDLLQAIGTSLYAGQNP